MTPLPRITYRRGLWIVPFRLNKGVNPVLESAAMVWCMVRNAKGPR